MTIAELLPSLKDLSRADKLQAIQVLLAELARDEGVQLQAGVELPVWSPHGASDAGEILLRMLDGDAQG